MIKTTYWIVSVVVAILTIILSCGLHVQKQIPKASTALVHFKIPMVRASGDMKVFEDSFYLTRYQDLTILQTPLNHFVERENGQIDTAVRYQYFIYAQHDTAGLLFDSIGAVASRSLNVDSFMHVKAFGGGLQLFDANNMRLVRSETKLWQGLQQCIYVPITKPDPQYGDTCIAYFNKKIPSGPFTLSSYLDGLGRGKLVRLEVVVAAIKDHAMTLPERRFSFSVKPSAMQGSHKLQQLVHMFENEKTEPTWAFLDELF